MITTYLLKNCKHCKGLLEYLKENPNVNICLIMVSKNEIPYIKYQEPRIKEFPVAFSGSPKVNGLPHKNSKMIPGSTDILQTLKTKFGTSDKLYGSNIDIDYSHNNSDNISSLNNIRRHRNNCFGRACHVMDRPFGPSDNQFILQGYQPSCAIPFRSDLPIKSSNNPDNYRNSFGITTPGTNAWKAERQPWPTPRILVNDLNCTQNLKANTDSRLNYPSTFSNDYVNRMRFYDDNPIFNQPNNNFGKERSKLLKKFSKKYIKKYLNKFVTAPTNSTKPFLTYAAGGNGISRITGTNYLREQIPIQRQRKDAYISGNIHNYVDKHSNSQPMLYNGLNSEWSTNAQGIIPRKSNYGKPKQIKQIKPIKPVNDYYKNVVKKVSRPGTPKILVKEINQKPYKVASKNMIQTTFNSSSGNSGIAQNFYKFTKNGNVFGKVKSTKMQNSKVKYTSPLGIEISF